MPVQDLTPQLRTRLSHVERAVGWFVMLGTLLLLAGFSYYVYHTAQRKGWFLTKLRYHTFVQSAAGLHPGDPVKLMGFDVGQVTFIQAMPPFSDWGNVYVEFLVHEPYYGYLWTDSYVKIVSAGFLGSRTLELVQGGTSTNKNLKPSYDVDKTGIILGVWDPHSSNYVAYTKTSKGYGFPPAQEAPVVTERLEALANQAQQALPGIFDITNQVSRLLSNLNQVTAHADGLLVQAQPVLTNLAIISSLITNGQGSLGDWVLPTNINQQLQLTLSSANTTLISANSNLNSVGSGLSQTLDNVANITSNLNAQVQRNDQIVSQISSTIVNADNLVQGLKHHWLLRSAFKEPKTNRPPDRVNEPATPVVPAAPKTGKRLPF